MVFSSHIHVFAIIITLPLSFIKTFSISSRVSTTALIPHTKISYFHSKSISREKDKLPPNYQNLKQNHAQVRVPHLWSQLQYRCKNREHAHSYHPRTALSLHSLRGGSTGNPNPSTSRWNTQRRKNRIIARRKDTEIQANNEKNQYDVSEPIRKRGRMYLTCILIVLLWISTGTIFYSKFNNWPLAQSFFYAVDAGMSIGFCTDVAETKIGSRAFTIIFILLGASSVGGALALFIQDIMEGAVVLRNCKFEQILAKNAFCRADKDGDGTLNYSEFRELVEQWTGCHLADEHFDKLYEKFGIDQKGNISSQTFLKKIPDLDKLLKFDNNPLYSNKWYIRKAIEFKEIVCATFNGHNRIFAACFAWVSMGIIWGKVRMKWDIITATHFAISALATGGLTGPPVDKNGILPLEPALFCGIFCLIGIPLFALTLAHFARVLVESQVVAEEKHAILRPLQRKEFELAKSLCSPEDQMVHLSDFIVLQLLKMGKVDMNTIDLMKTQFEILDVEGSGRLPQKICIQDQISPDVKRSSK